MTTSEDVRQYIESTRGVFGEAHLQKLVYYSQAWSLAWDGAPMFRERVEAWQRGPVVADLWRRRVLATVDGLDEVARATVDAVLDYYAAMPGAVLSQRTHAEAPWRDAWGDLPGSERGSQEITQSAMRRFYTREAIAGRGPQRRQMDFVEADTDQFLGAAAQNAKRWHGALELLAR